MDILHLDHWVLTVSDVTPTIDFYTRYLGMKAITFGNNRKALQFGHQKINLHLQGSEIEPHAQYPKPGSADMCFIIEGPLEAAYQQLQLQGVQLESGLVERTGALGPIRSFYLRDPDGNLIEMSCYDATS